MSQHNLSLLLNTVKNASNNLPAASIQIFRNVAIRNIAFNVIVYLFENYLFFPSEIDL